MFDHYVVACSPVTATLTHRTSVTTTVNGRDQTTYSRSVHVLEKRGGRWQVVSNAGHAIPAAVVTGVNRVRGRDAQGKPFDRRIRFTDTFIKRDGRWQLWATQGTTIP